MAEPGPFLRITERCLLEDLRITDTTIPLELLAQSIPMVRAFLEMRAQSPIGAEWLRPLTTKAKVYTLHAGDDRGATWHQEKAGIVWLLAAAFHRSGKPDDAYPYFRELDADGRLMPTDADVDRHVESLKKTFAGDLIDAVPAVRAAAIANRGKLLQVLLAERISVRVTCDASDPAIITVAISRTIRPGSAEVPPDWLLRVALAFLSGATVDSLMYAQTIGGEPIAVDEDAFADFA